MTAAVLLALAAQVVTLQPADLEAKAAYVRVAVGVESRLTLPEPAVRVRGQQSAKELLGLRLGQVRPKGVLLIRPREAGVARLVFEGATRRIRLDIEASALGAAQDVEFRMSEPVAAGKPDARPTPQAPRTMGAAVEASAPSPSPAPPDAPVATPPPAVAEVPAADRAADDHGPETAPAPGPTATPAPTSEGRRQVARIGRYVGMPGQRGIWVDELVREGARVSLRLRVEGGSGAVEVGALDIEGTRATVRTEVAGKDLIIIGEVPLPAERPRQATLGMAEHGKFREEKLKLVGPGLADLAFDGGRTW